MHLLVKSPATSKACSESARLAGGAEPQLLAALGGPPCGPPDRPSQHTASTGTAWSDADPWSMDGS